MTPIEKAAQEAAADYYDKMNRRGFGTREELQEIITKHLAPVQAELDAKDKLLQEAVTFVQKRYLRLFHDYEDSANFICYATCEKCAAKNWLARLSNNE